MTLAAPQLEPELDRLYALPLADFIGARNALTKRLRAAGERQAAGEVKALAKPSLTAWVVNALFHHDRQRFDRLLEAAAAVRAALAGEGDRRRAEAARRQALRALLGRAAEILDEAGHAVTPANRQRISHTLEALAARDPAADGPRAGRLARDLEPQGFDVLAGLAASLAPPRSAAPAPRKPRKRPGKKRAAPPAPDPRREEARRKLDERQAELDELERAVETAEAAAREAAERQARLLAEAAEAERRARRAAAAAAAAKKETAAARAALTEARAARRKGMARLAAARRLLERSGG